MTELEYMLELAILAFPIEVGEVEGQVLEAELQLLDWLSPLRELPTKPPWPKDWLRPVKPLGLKNAVIRFSMCLKTKDKVSFNIASQARCVYILSDKSSLKCQKWSIWRVCQPVAVKQCYQTDKFKKTQIDGKCQNEIQMRHFEQFSCRDKNVGIEKKRKYKNEDEGI